MRYSTLILSVLALLTLNSCCSSCHRFWDNVAQGDFYDETLHSKVDGTISSSAPNQYKTISRVILSRGGGEQSFTLIAKVSRDKRSISFGGMADLGTVMFSGTIVNGKLSLTKNNSGWSDPVFQDVFKPLFSAIFLPQLEEASVVQSLAGGKLMHRSRRHDGNIDTYVFDKDGGRWIEYRLQAFSFFGEIEKVQRVRFNDFKSVEGWTGSYPYSINIDDAIHGFKAQVSVQRVTPH